MPRIAYLAAAEKDFYKRLDNLMDISARSLKVKRTVITKLLEQGLYPYTKRYLGTFNNHFSTIGLIGMNEVGLNAKWLRADLTDERVQRFTRDVLNHMRERLSDYQEQYGDLYNLEATPAESTTYRFAKHDKEQFPDIITANMNGTPYYTNSSHLPVGYTEDVFSALDIQDDLQTLYTSGTVFHAFLGEKLPDWKAAANLVRKIAENYKLPYYTMSPTYSVCRDHGYLTGEQYTCPICGRKTEVYSRITGYYRPVQNWNDGKAQEYKDRKVYNIGHSRLRHTGPNPAPVDLPLMQPAAGAGKTAAAAAEKVSAATAVLEREPEAETRTVASAAQTAATAAAKTGAAAREMASPQVEVTIPLTEIIPDIMKSAGRQGMLSPKEKRSKADFVKMAEAVDMVEMEAPTKVGTIILFKTPTCPNCRAAAALLDKAGINYTALNANEEKELVKKFGVKQAPTLVLIGKESYEKYRGVSNIKGWLMGK